MALDVFANLSPTLTDEAKAFFTERRVDAEPRPGKHGAMTLQASTRSPGFLYVNWSGSVLELLMLTHELGHGTHSALAARDARGFRSRTSGTSLLAWKLRLSIRASTSGTST